MRTRGWISAVGTGLVLGLTALLSAADVQIEAERLVALVAQLGSPRYQERELAMRTLDAFGAVALPALRAAIQSEDLEVRRRAEELVRRIDRRLEAAKLLEPRRLHLQYKDLPVDEAVKDLARRTGYPIQLQADQMALAQRKITLDTGDVPFWEAFHQFCQKAGLVERALLLNARPSTLVANGPLGAGGGFQGRGVNQTRSSADQPWVLVDGQMPDVPSWRSSAVRVLALPKMPSSGDRPRASGERSFTLDVLSEGKIQWQGILEVRLDPALDEHDQPFTLAPGGLGLAGEMEILLANNLGNGVLIWDAETGMPMNTPRRLPIRLMGESRPGKVLKEVSGTIAAQVQTPLQPLITADQVLKSAGQTFRGGEGESLKVLEIMRHPEGVVRLRVEVEQPLANPGAWGGAALVRGNRVIAMNGRFRGVIQRELNPAGFSNLTVVDATGQNIPLELAESEMTAAGTGVTQRYQLGYRRAEGQPDAAKLILHGRRTLVLEVPFTLKDVPIQ